MQSQLMRKRWFILIFIYVTLLVSGWFFADWITDQAIMEITPENRSMINTMIATASVIYVAASATPFIPGAEIGFGLLFVFGASMAILVYSCMVLALTLAYLAGRFIPVANVARFFGYLGLVKAQKLVTDMASLNSKQRMEHLTSNAPNRLIPILLRHRYLALIVLLNIPGNTVLGGGGGIAFTAGISGLYRFPTYLLSIMLAAAPIPILFLVTQNFA